MSDTPAHGAATEPPDEHETHGDGAGDNAYALTAPEPPQRLTGWRHLPPERWRPDRIRPAPYNDKVRRMAPTKLARLRAGIERFGLAGTFLVRAEDGLLIGGHRRFEIALALIEEHAGDMGELERLNLFGRVAGVSRVGRDHVGDFVGVSIAVSPILGIPDAEALALNILLNNREAQGEFAPMGLAEALSALDANGFDVTDTGFSVAEVGSLVTWEPDDTREGGAKAAGADVPRATPTPEPVNKSAEKSHTPAPLVLPCTREDVERAVEALREVSGRREAENERFLDLDAAADRLAKLLELPRAVLGDEPPLDFGAAPIVCRRCGLERRVHEILATAPTEAHWICADGEPAEFAEAAT